MPVVFRNRVIFSGIKELTALNLKSGKVIKRIPLGKGDFSSHMFGRRVVPFGDSILYPSNNLVLLLNIDSFEETGRITIPENSNSSPAVYNDRIVIVNRKGVLFTINPVTSDIESTIESDALQPVSSAPTIIKDSAVFAGRGGNVVFTDLMKNEIVWEKKIDVSKGVGIFQDVSLGERAVYPFTGREFYALSIKDGKDLFKPVLSTSPPMYHEGKLYFGDYRNRLVVMNASTGRILKSWKLDSKITIQPAVYGNDIMVGTESGIIYRINVKYM
jgi:outer membrane protein assembly factor BamB